jgi:hypothetical protein
MRKLLLPFGVVAGERGKPARKTRAPGGGLGGVRRRGGSLGRSDRLGGINRERVIPAGLGADRWQGFEREIFQERYLPGDFPGAVGCRAHEPRIGSGSCGRPGRSRGTRRHGQRRLGTGPSRKVPGDGRVRRMTTERALEGLPEAGFPYRRVLLGRIGVEGVRQAEAAVRSHVSIVRSLRRDAKYSPAVPAQCSRPYSLILL